MGSIMDKDCPEEKTPQENMETFLDTEKGVVLPYKKSINLEVSEKPSEFWAPGKRFYTTEYSEKARKPLEQIIYQSEEKKIGPDGRVEVIIYKSDQEGDIMLGGKNQEKAEYEPTFDDEDVSTSELYRLQEKVFSSETSTDKSNQPKEKLVGTDQSPEEKTQKDVEKEETEDLDDTELTEQVRYAMEKAEMRKKFFDTEERNILKMGEKNSESSEKGQERLQKPLAKNMKYYL